MSQDMTEVNVSSNEAKLADVMKPLTDALEADFRSEVDHWIDEGHDLTTALAYALEACENYNREIYEGVICEMERNERTNDGGRV